MAATPDPPPRIASEELQERSRGAADPSPATPVTDKSRSGSPPRPPTARERGEDPPLPPGAR